MQSLRNQEKKIIRALIAVLLCIGSTIDVEAYPRSLRSATWEGDGLLEMSAEAQAQKRHIVTASLANGDFEIPGVKIHSDIHERHGDEDEDDDDDDDNDDGDEAGRAAEYYGEAHPEFGKFQIHKPVPHHRVGMRPPSYQLESRDEEMPQPRPGSVQYGIQPDQPQHVQDIHDIQRIQDGGMDDYNGDQVEQQGLGLYGNLSKRRREEKRKK